MNEQSYSFGPSALLLVCLSALVSSGCRPDLPITSSEPFANLAPPEISVTFDPPLPLEAAAQIMRARLSWVEPIDAARVFLVRGEVTDYQLRQIERDDISKTLMERIVPAVVWTEEPYTVVIAPTVVLEKGQTYAVAIGEPSKAVHFTVGAGENAPPLFRRIWPPAEKSPITRLGIFCAAVELSDHTANITLEPEGPPGILSRNIVANGPGRDCLRLEVAWDEALAQAGPFVLPPVVEFPWFGGTTVQIEPMPIEPLQSSMEEIQPLECGRGEVPFGLGCAQVMDDRILARAPEGELLWGIKGAGMDVVMTTSTKERFVLKELAPDSDIELDVVAIDLSGQTYRESFVTRTDVASSHVVLNEVMANPMGPEPHQEWVELYNDGRVDAMLGGYRILDIGGETVLPDVVLPPGQFAVVVNETYVEDDEVDVVPAKGTILVRVPRLGKSGLSNSGELLRLEDSNGETISRFPALPKPKAGQSVSRAFPSAPDSGSSYFMVSEATPGSTNIVSTTP